MSVRDCLKATRAELAARAQPAPGFGAAVELALAFDAAINRHALTTREAYEARDLLEVLVSPAHVAAKAAVARWHQTQAESDGRAAVYATTRPGSASTLEDWLEAPGRKLSDVVGLIDRAIEKSKPGRDA